MADFCHSRCTSSTSWSSSATSFAAATRTRFKNLWRCNAPPTSADIIDSVSRILSCFSRTRAGPSVPSSRLSSCRCWRYDIIMLNLFWTRPSDANNKTGLALLFNYMVVLKVFCRPSPLSAFAKSIDCLSSRWVRSLETVLELISNERKILGREKRWFEPGAAGWEVRTLPLCYADPPPPLVFKVAFFPCAGLMSFFL